MRSPTLVVALMMLMSTTVAMTSQATPSDLSGWVVDADGQPAAGATVMVADAATDGFEPRNETAVITGPDGAFSLGAPGDAVVAVLGDRHAVATNPSPGKPLVLELTQGGDAEPPVITEADLQARAPQPEAPDTSALIEQSQAPPLEPVPLPEQLTDLLASEADTDIDASIPMGATNPLLTLYVRGVGQAWAIGVPYPADLNGNLIPDGTITVMPTLSLGTSVEVCFEMNYIHTLGSRSGLSIGVAYEGHRFFVFGSQIPADLKVCVRPNNGAPIISLDADDARGTVEFYVETAGNTVYATLDSMPRRVDLTFTPETFGDGATVTYSADRTVRLRFAFDGAVYVVGDINRVPSSFTADFSRRTTWGTYNFVDLDYSASGTISSLIVLFRPYSGASDYVQAELSSLPSSLDASLYFAGSGGNIRELEYSHSASSSLGQVIAHGNSDGTPFYVRLKSLPSSITRAEFTVSDGGWYSIGRVRYAATSSVQDIIGRFGNENTKTFIYVQAPSLPKTVDATWSTYTSGGSLDGFTYSHSASSGIAWARVIAQIGYHDLDIDAYLSDIPSSASISYRMRNVGGGEIEPYLYLDASTSGFDAQAYVDGRKLGTNGYVYADLDNLPRTLRTTITKEWNNIMSLDFNTKGTGTADQIYLWAYLPLALADKPTQQLGMYFEDMSRFEVELKAILPAHKRCFDQGIGIVCQNFLHRSASYAYLYHHDLVIEKWGWLTINPGDLTYKGQEKEWCWNGYWIQCYVTKYTVNAPNYSLYIPSYFGGGDVRNMGYT